VKAARDVSRYLINELEERDARISSLSMRNGELAESLHRAKNTVILEKESTANALVVKDVVHVGKPDISPVSYTHLTLPTICSV